MGDEMDVPAPKQGNSSENSPRSQWLKEMTALVGLLAVVTGACVSVAGLVQKGKSDHETAEVERETARLQANVQLDTAKRQAAQHDEDQRQARLIHDLDLKSKQDEVAAAETSERNKRLAEVVSHLFSNQSSSEGDLAILSQFVSGDRESRQIVEKAVLARLETPRTREEIDLGLRIFDQMGPSAWSYVVGVNQSARSRYDRALLQRFVQASRARSANPPKVDGPTAKLWTDDEQIEREIVRGEVVAYLKGAALSYEYDLATLNWSLKRHRMPDGEGVLENNSALIAEQDLASAEILRSNAVLRRYIAKRSSEMPRQMDLSGTYLDRETVFDPAVGAISPPVSSAIVGDAYLDGVNHRELGDALQQFDAWRRRPPEIIDDRTPCEEFMPRGCEFSEYHAEAPYSEYHPKAP